MDPLRLMMFHANGSFTINTGPEYKYYKILKAAKTLQLDALMIQETHVNGPVDGQVTDVKSGVTLYG